jgi:hypothetical protein
MPSTTFVDFSTPITAGWLNDVNSYIYGSLSGTPVSFRIGPVGGFTETNLGRVNINALGDGVNETLSINASNGAGVNLYNNAALGAKWTTGAGGLTMNLRSATDTGVTFTATGSSRPDCIRFFSTGIEQARMFSSGRWVFGTSAPTDNGVDTLQVTGSVRVSQGLQANTLSSVGQTNVSTNTSPPAGGAATAGINLSNVANFGVYFGSGAPTFSAAQGSLYMRTDGSSTSTRMYVNTNGTTGWTNLVTAA